MIQIVLQKKLHGSTNNMVMNMNCSFEKGQLISLYGASGAGKTSVLRMLAGLMKPESGFIKMNDEVWFDSHKKIDLKPQRRKVGFVFQDYALFPNMNVRENIAYALSKNDARNIIDEVLEMTALTSFASRRIQTLSGGENKRVALARAIARRPYLLLLDEPLSAIDVPMRQQLQSTLAEVHKRFQLTTILVSHDVDEILKLSDAMIYLNQGVAEQYERPSDFFLKSKTAGLTATILSVSEKSLRLLINNRFIEMASNEPNNFKEGDKIELVFKEAVPLIRKL